MPPHDEEGRPTGNRAATTSTPTKITASVNAHADERHGCTTCPICDGTGTIPIALDYVRNFQRRVIQHALAEAHPAQLRARAQRIRAAAQPRPGDFPGRNITTGEQAARRRRMENLAIALDQKAAVLEGPDAVIDLAVRLGLLAANGPGKAVA